MLLLYTCQTIVLYCPSFVAQCDQVLRPPKSSQSGNIVLLLLLTLAQQMLWHCNGVQDSSSALSHLRLEALCLFVYSIYYSMQSQSPEKPDDGTIAIMALHFRTLRCTSVTMNLIVHLNLSVRSNGSLGGRGKGQAGYFFSLSVLYKCLPPQLLMHFMYALSVYGSLAASRQYSK